MSVARVSWGDSKITPPLPKLVNYENESMDGLTELLQKLNAAGHLNKHLRGVFHTVIGRRLTRGESTVISVGITWRELANRLKDLKIEPEVVSQLGVDPEDLSPRERQRFWYSAIAIAKPDSPQARSEAEPVISTLKSMGYEVGPAPAPSTTLSTPLPPPLPKKPKAETDEASPSRTPSKKKKPK